MMQRALPYVIIPAIVFVALSSAVSGTAEAATKKWFPGHYLTAKHHEASQITDIRRNLVRQNPNFTGYKSIYTWKSLEPAKDRYDFSPIIRDLQIAKADNKKLLVHLADRVFGRSGNPNLPAYMLTAEYEGGWFSDGQKSMGKFWIPAYQVRWNKLIQKLGEALDNHPDLAGVIVEETSGLPKAEKVSNSYTNDRMLQHVKSMNSTAARYLPKTVFIQYVNFGISPDDRGPLMNHIVKTEKGAFGSPDTFNCKKNPPLAAGDNGFGSFFKTYRGIAPISLENQPWGYECLDARRVFDYAVNQIGVNFMVWSPVTMTNWRSKWTINDAIAVINANKGKINNSRPTNVF